jgi:hypothetical protein
MKLKIILNPFLRTVSVNDGAAGLNGNYGDLYNYPGTGQGWRMLRIFSACNISLII